MAHGAPQPLMDWARWNGRKERTSATSTTGAPPIWERYQTFIKANPHVLPEALHLARARLAAGEKRIGAKALWEELRRSIRVKKLGSYKLNNSYTALLARDLIAADPRLERAIVLRERKTAIDKAVDETTPIPERDMPQPDAFFLEHEFAPFGMRVVAAPEATGGVRATLQRLVPERAGVCSRAHYVDLVSRSAPTAKEAVAHMIPEIEEIASALARLVTYIDPDLGR